ncbi:MULTISPECIES: hypothetical protein [Burkholderia]|uniref:hypothetical protein n=1 Tax=Burkholderia TaxID=32008 RepID=UPI000A82D6B6|nr:MULTISPECIES: hypothetical protein [Burkholderia]MCA7982101.1 hypothetical protein [Burkholderia cepacia]
MKRQPKAFQRATIRHVVAALNRGSARRFLVADEAGLGKTMVARGVIEALTDEKRSCLTVFYVCSSQPIASQNADSLLSFLDEDEIAAARTKIDRPSLLPLSDLPRHRKVRLFTLTPSTAYSGGRQGLQRGHALERALGCAFLQHLRGRQSKRMQEHLSMGVAKFDEYVRKYRASLTAKVRENDLETRRILRAFRSELMVAVAASRTHFWNAFDKLLNENAALMASIVRNAMAAAVLRALKPDLIIFDEFQRFRELMSRSEKDLSKDPRVRGAQKNIIDILLARTEPARLLMLSATPYEALASGINARHRHEDGDSDFFEIVRFLFEHDARGVHHFQRVRDQFGIVENELRRNSPDSTAACQAREELTRLLLKVMCRTERPRQKRQGMLLDAPPLSLADLRVFEDFATPMDNHVQPWAVPLWASVPAPIQTLGSKYQCWKGTRFTGSKPILRRKEIADGVIPRSWPHPKLRGLFAALPASSLSLPWLRPSLPWWTLKGPWSSSNASRVDGKVLVFSRFAATPAAVSGLVSYDVETRMLGSAREARKGYEAVARASHFKVTADAPAIFTLFFASSFLASANPLLRGVPKTVAAAKAVIRRQLRDRLKIKVLKQVKRKLMKPHVLLISLEMRQGSWNAGRDAWVKALVSGGSVARQAAESALSDWEAKADPAFNVLAESEFDLLVNLTLDSPGVVVERALRRHWTQVPTDKPEPSRGAMQREAVQALLLGGFRKYFDKPWFATTLRRAGLRSEGKTRGRSKDYPSALRAAVVAGNLESVLDEHFWTMAKSGKPWDEGLKELTDALNVSGGRALFRERGKNTSRFDLRCHVAMPLHPGKTESNQLSGERPARPDQVRHAFNSPFWPYVVSTTSVGQEGLDFHLWCRSVCHWDPARGPVELEQREGRVARFAGLAIRRALASHKERPMLPANASPWASISEWATTIEDPATQMQPWWCLDEAETVQCYFAPAGSREHQQRELLERARALYRLVLGTTNPEPLLEELEVDSTVTPEWAASASLNLVPPR